MNVANKIADWLHEKEITHAYGIIGAGNAVLFDAISKKGKTALICCHHEQSAVMASGAHNPIAGGLRSVAIVTTGAGSTNAITGVVAAYMDSTPLIVLSGNEASKYIGAPTRVLGVQGYDSSGMIAKHTKWANRAHAEVPIRAQLEIALENAMTPRQGPVWLDIPKDLQTHAA